MGRNMRLGFTVIKLPKPNLARRPVPSRVGSLGNGPRVGPPVGASGSTVVTHAAKCHIIPHGLEHLSGGVRRHSALAYQSAQCSRHVQEALVAGGPYQCLPHHLHGRSRGDAGFQQIAHDHERHGGACARFPPDRREGLGCDPAPQGVSPATTHVACGVPPRRLWARCIRPEYSRRERHSGTVTSGHGCGCGAASEQRIGPAYRDPQPPSGYWPIAVTQSFTRS